MPTSKLKKPIRRMIINLNYYLGNYKNVVWLVGDGRSGTTWVTELINWNKKYRVLLEPFHPRFVKSMEDFFLYHYIRPDDNKSPLCNILRLVFSGKFKHSRRDILNRRPLFKGLLIKDIFAHLFIAWVKKHLPQVKIILLIRNPFAVALSKEKTKNWKWMADPKEFLNQTSLCLDHIDKFRDLINRASSDYIERQLIIWGIIHYVPFKQLKGNCVYVVFYENLLNNFQDELLELLNYISTDEYTSLDSNLVKNMLEPSRFSGKYSNIVLRKSPIDRWKKELSVQQIDNGVKLLDQFGLADIYGTSSTPQKDVVETLLKSH
jgi:hypothetical protein